MSEIFKSLNSKGEFKEHIKDLKKEQKKLLLEV